ncbi:MAG: histidine--tRNA ligase [Thermoprotei archaeon]|nr:MAG: histidine--tRNA ligase [Thermoprotei archaeon]
MAYRRPRGTRDYLPEECEERRAVLEGLREVFELYGYGEVVTPAFEHLELLVAKAGEEVKEQIYWFKDKAGRMLGLRFELTTPIARIVAERPTLPKPIRLYYIQPVWRYEEPQRGRLREFWQAGVELIGVKEVWGDAEVVALLVNALKRVGLTSFKVYINDRRVAEGLLNWAGIPEEALGDALRAIDKLERRGADYVRERLKELGAEPGRLERLMDMLAEGELTELAEVALASRAREGVRSLEQLLEELEDAYELASYIEVDLSVVRGLDYYTSLVYEVKVSGLEGLGSVAGGGRYDDLIELVGGPPLPATGMAIGVERLIEALRAQGVLPQKRGRRGVIVIPVSAQYRRAAIRIAEELRRRGISAVVELTGRKLSTALEAADKRGFRYAIIVGGREVESGLLTVRDLEKWREERAPLSSVVSMAAQ